MADVMAAKASARVIDKWERRIAIPIGLKRCRRQQIPVELERHLRPIQELTQLKSGSDDVY